MTDQPLDQVNMAVRLESFEFIPRSVDGWCTPQLQFGTVFTAVQGENGEGKTPVMKGIMQALGHDVDLPPEIVQHCSAARLRLTVDGRPLSLTRRLEPQFNLRIEDGEETTVFSSEAEYAVWFTSLVGGSTRTLTNKQGKAAELYANLIFPSFWVDQDHGWTTDYYTPKNLDFIQDQRLEVIRFLMGLPARHPFRAKTDFENAKEAFDRVEKAVEMQRFVVERLRTNSQLRDDEEPALLGRSAMLQAALAANSETIEAVRDLTSFFERDIAAIEAERSNLLSNADALSRRKGQLSLVLSELDGEVEILATNVQAADLLRQLCSRQDCEMFAMSAQSYGRSLLYLKDQIKDLQTSKRDINRDADTLSKQLARLDQALAAKQAQRAAALANSPQAQLMSKIDAITKDVVEVELRLANFRQYTTEKVKFEQLLNRLEQARAEVAASRPQGLKGDANAIEDVRLQLTDAMQQWIVTLATKNTNTARFDENFVLYIDGEKFSADTHQSGSTRTRIVLAFHAALLEVSLLRGGNHPGWLFFDAPKQHELNQRDFDAYTERLRLISDRYPMRVQIVFSAADLKTQFEVGDEVWRASFTLGNELRFLGPQTT